nr:DUF4234 domain-containing protein [Amphibacillus sediminis]
MEITQCGGKTILLIFITCGIYTLFWYYIVGQKIAEIHRMKNMLVKDNGLLYIVLSIFSLGIVANAIVQHDVNQIV